MAGFCSLLVQRYLLVAVLLGTATQFAAAQVYLPSASPGEFTFAELAEAAVSAKQSVRFSRPELVQEKKESLERSLRALDWYLQTSGPLVHANWRGYLRWDELQQELAADEPDLATLDEIRNLMLANEPGLEHPSFIAARTELLAYMNEVLLASQGTDFRDYYEDRLDKLAEALRSYEDQPSEADAQLIGGVLGMLERFNQAPELVSQLRAKFGLPNLRVFITPAFMTAAMETQIAEPSQSRDVILGTSTRSQVMTIGSLRMVTLPSARGARLAIEFLGNATAQSVGVNGPATICTFSRAQLGGTLTLAVTPEGLLEQDATASATTQTQITGIGAKLKIVRRIASRRAAKQKGLAEQIAASKARTKLAENLRSRGAELVADANRRLEEKIIAPLQRKDAYPRSVELSSGYNGLLAKITHATRFQIAAHNRPPVPLRTDIDAGVLLHESFAGNLSSSLIGGVTISSERMVETFEKYDLELPEDLQNAETAAPWTFTFALSQPVSTEFGDSTVKITLRGDKFSRSGREFNRSVEASALYEVKKSETGAMLVRKNPVDVNVGRGGINVTIKTFLENKFEAAMPKEIELGKIIPKGQLARVGTLHFRQFVLQPQWATISIIRGND
jgi:hypothetical protein